ncbi:MAG: PaaX family transcriptional regulator C-terminal domain-containing protein [Rhabdaerophilum sp.]
MAEAPAPLQALIAVHHARKPPRTWSLLVTIFGVVALPRGEALRLSDLQDWLGALGIEPGLVRTALSRLVSNGTLTRERDGKAALYRLSAGAEDDFGRAAALIFGDDRPQPDGRLHLVLIEEGSDRAALRADLAESGYGALAATCFIRPVHAGREDRKGEGLTGFHAEGDGALAARLQGLWPLAGLQAGYRMVAGHAAALMPLVPDLGWRDAFLARLLLVHEFRRLVLRDPFLPEGLLPPDWPGPEARRLFDEALGALEARLRVLEAQRVDL